MKRSLKLMVFVAVLATATMACSVLAGRTEIPTVGEPPQAVQVQPVAPGSPATNPVIDQIASQDILVNLYEQVNPGVVAIRVLSDQGGSQGSGFVVDSEGHIVTNYHVVENLTDLEVAFSSGLKVRGEVLGTDLDSDIAVIKVDVPANQLSPLPLGNSDQVKVGQAVVAIGNPFGYSGTMTTGIVSAKGRTLESLHQSTTGGTFSAGDIIQTDTAINPGNSGGPLLNLSGEVIGINRAIATGSSTGLGEPTSSGVGFAVSINIVKRVLPTLIAGETYRYPYVGIFSLDEITLLQQEALGLPRSTGVYVTQLAEDGPAAKAGIRVGDQPTDNPSLQAGGDLIIAIDGVEVKDFSEFISYLLKNKSPGDQVALTVLRGEQQIEVMVTLAERPSQ